MKKCGWCLLIVVTAAVILAGCAGAGAPAAPPAGGTPSGAGPAAGADWQKRWDNTLAAAKREGKVTIYGELGSEAKTALTERIKDRFGLELETVIGSGPEVAAKYVQEVRSGIYLADVLFNGSPTFLTTIKPNVELVPISRSFILPEIRDPKVWPEGGIPFLDKDQLIIQSTLGRIFFGVVNTDQVKEGEITSLRDYLDPKWKGKIVMWDPTVAGSTSSWFSVILTQIYGQDEGRKYLSQLAQQEPLIIRDKRLPVEWVAKGKYAIHIGPNMQMVAEFVKAGAPVKATREKEGIFLNPSSSCFALVAKPAHPNAAVIVANWLMTAEAGAILSKAWGAPAARQDVPTTGLDPANLPLPSDKIYLNTEQLVLYTTTSQQIARDIFGPLIK